MAPAYAAIRLQKKQKQARSVRKFDEELVAIAPYPPKMGAPFSTGSHMDNLLTDSTVWWLCAGCAVAVELLTGTFYLLMLACGLAAAALAAQMGASTSAQFITAAVVGGAAVAGWHLLRTRGEHKPTDGANPDLHLDVGETVQVKHWDADGNASVKYRGAHWAVMHRPGVQPQPGAHRVAEVVGNRLLVDKL